MRAITRILSKVKKTHRQILLTFCIALFGLLTSIAIALPLDKVDYHIVITAEGYPIIWPQHNVYGFAEQLSATELVNSSSYCSSGAGCSPEALAKGARYYKIHTVSGVGQVIAYYDVNGKLVATQKGGSGSPTHPTTVTPPTKLAAPNVASYSDSSGNPVGYIEAEFAVSDSGAATYNIPLALPPGTAGVKPEISLSYSSQSGEGIAGLGWSLSGLSGISRCGKNLAKDGVIAGIKFDHTDNLCLDGQRLIRISGAQGANGSRYKTEIDSYSDIIAYDSNGDRAPEYFEVRTKAGEIHSYGNSENSRLKRQSTAPVNISAAEKQKAYSWTLNRTADRLGNYIDYVYAKDTASGTEQTLKEIQYTGNSRTGLAPYNVISFHYGAKIQPRMGYFHGTKLRQSKRLKSIQIRNESKLIRSYKLAYFNQSSSKINRQDRLFSIEECGDTACLPKTHFKWDGAHKSDSAATGSSSLAARPASTLIDAMQSDFMGHNQGKIALETWGVNRHFEWGTDEKLELNRYSDVYHPNHSTKLLGDVNGDGISDVVGVRYAALRAKITTNHPGNKPSNGEPYTTVRYENRRTPQVEVGLGTANKALGLDMDSFDASTIGPPPSSGGSTNSEGSPFKYPVYLADVNGDGKADLVSVNYQRILVNLSDGTKFLAARVWSSHSFTYSNDWGKTKPHPRFVQDVNGDGKADLIGIGHYGVYVSLSTGSGFAAHTQWSRHFGTDYGCGTCTTYGGIGYWHEGASAELVDVSGDGLPDVIVHNLRGTTIAINNPVTKRFDLLKPRVSGHWGYDVTNPPGSISANKDTPRLLGDVNGDGNVDLVGFFDKVYVAYGTGKGFLPYQEKYSAFTKTHGGWSGNHHPRHVIDVNGDGKADIVGFSNSGTVVALSSGEGFNSEQWSHTFGNDAAAWNYDKNRSGASYNNLRSFGDFNGDGLVDIIGINQAGVHIGENQAESLRITQIGAGGFVPDVTQSNVAGLHRVTDIQYEKLTEKTGTVYTKTAADAIQPAMYVVSAHHTSKGIVSSARDRLASMEYRYENYKVDRKYGPLGFNKRRVTDLMTGIVTEKIYQQSISNADDFVLVGQALSDYSYYQPKGSRQQYLNSKSYQPAYQAITAAGGKYYRVYSQKIIERDYTLNSHLLYQEITKSSSAPSACGNTRQVQTDSKDLQTGHTYSNSTYSVYPTSGDCFAQSRLSSSVVDTLNGSDRRQRSASFSYYPSGQLKTETIQPGHALSSTTSYVYDAYGNVSQKSISGANGSANQTRTVKTRYDAKGRFAITTTNALGHSVSTSYDKRFGTLSSSTGPNGLTSKSYYNQFGQKYLTVSPNNAWVHTQYQWHNLNVAGNMARYRTLSSDSQGKRSENYYDHLDRVLRSKSKLPNGQYVIKDKVYNLDNGTLMKESLPYLTGKPAKWVNYGYDPLLRNTRIQQPGQNPSSISYNGLITTLSDALGNRKTQQKNVLGKPDKTTDALGNTIRYYYHSDGNLNRTITTAAAGNGQKSASNTNSTVSFNYDALGNKISMVDPDMGNWRYQYNAFGELISQTDANRNTTRNSYDALGRLKTRSDALGTTTWNYDSAAHGLGKLASVSAPLGYKKSHNYTPLGQLASVSETLPDSPLGGSSKAYSTRYQYDAHGRLDTLHYPTADPAKPFALKHSYDPRTGALKTIRHAHSGKNYWSANLDSLDHFGNLTQQSLGNGVVTHRSYDDLGRIKSIQSGKGGSTALQNLSYSFDAIGNLISRQDARINVQENFGYDELYRLKSTRSSYQGSAATAETMDYDGHGNLLSKHGQQYQYHHSQPHAVSSIGNHRYRYDANGNLTSGGGRNISWTPFNKPASITRGQQTLTLAYGAERQRILKQSNNHSTWYIGAGLLEREKNADGSEKYTFNLKAGSQTISHTQHKSNSGSWTGENTRYLLTDHLGSIDIVSNEAGQQQHKLSFDAWGQRRTAGWGVALPGSSALNSIINAMNAASIRQGYTGHEQDDEVGLINMKGRLYDAEIGRFISADPHIQAPTDTQSYNRYTYVKNNPLSYTDPSGYFFASLFKKVRRFFKKWGRTILAIGLSFLTAGLAIGAVLGQGFTLAVQGSWLAAAAGGAAAGFTGTLVATGSFSAALKAGVFGGISGALTFGIANRFGIASRFKAIAHGVAQGGINVLRGGKFGAGFVSAFVSHSLGSAINGIGNGIKQTKYIIARTVAAAIVGGTVAKAVGGKFANGAITAAFVHLFNHESRQSMAKAMRQSAKNYKYGARNALQGIATSLDVTSKGALIFAVGSSYTGVGAIVGGTVSFLTGLVSSGLQIILDVTNPSIGFNSEPIQNQIPSLVSYGVGLGLKRTPIPQPFIDRFTTQIGGIGTLIESTGDISD